MRGICGKGEFDFEWSWVLNLLSLWFEVRSSWGYLGFLEEYLRGFGAIQLDSACIKSKEIRVNSTWVP